MPDPRASEAPGLKSDHLVVVLALATLIQALATFSVFALPTLAPEAAATFGLAPQLIGYQVSVMYVAAATLSGFGGLVVRRFGAVTTSLGALTLASIGLLGLASGSLVLTVLGSLCIGTGYSVTNPAGTHMLLRHEPPGHRNLIFAIKQAGVPLGAIIASTMLPRLAERIGWQGAIASSVVLMAALAIPLLIKRSRWDADADPTTRFRSGALASIVLIVRHPVLLSLSVTGFCYAAFQVCTIAFAVTMLATEFGWSLVAAGSIAAVMQAAGIFGRITWSVVADRFGNGLMMLALIGVLAATLGVLTSTMSPAWPVAGMVLVLALFGDCIIGWNGIYMAETARVSGPRDAGLATGGVLIFNFAGVIVGPALFGLTARANGSIASTFGMFSVLPLIGMLSLLPVLKYDRRRAPGD